MISKINSVRYKRKVNRCRRMAQKAIDERQFDKAKNLLLEIIDAPEAQQWVNKLRFYTYGELPLLESELPYNKDKQ